jgi:nucleoid-associated protein YgaU
MGLFSRDDKEQTKPDFSNVRSGSSTTATAPAPAAGAAAETLRIYTVKSGDSLSKIAKHEYGDASKWRRIYEANKDVVENPDLIYPGQTLTIP